MSQKLPVDTFNIFSAGQCNGIELFREMTNLTVIALGFGSVVALPVSLSKPVKISRLFTSGTYLDTSSSNVKRPFSTN